MSDEATDEIIKLLDMSDKDRDAYFATLPPDGTSTLLIADLQEKPACPVREKLIELAKTYWYDDFKTLNQSACPKVTLHADLKAAGYNDLARNVMDGKYD